MGFEGYGLRGVRLYKTLSRCTCKMDCVETNLNGCNCNDFEADWQDKGQALQALYGSLL
jgi:hypothetical protein